MSRFDKMDLIMKNMILGYSSKVVSTTIFLHKKKKKIEVDNLCLNIHTFTAVHG